MRTSDKTTVKKLHKIAGTLALLVILTFFSFSLYAELARDLQLIRMVKTGILYGILLLFVIMPAVVVSGKKSAGTTTSPIVGRKLKRMKLIAADALILIVLAMVLYHRAVNNMIDQTFVAIQLIEFVFGLLNAVFLILMIRDGRILSGKTEPSLTKNA